MPSVAMTGSDTIILNDRVFANLAEGDAISLTFPNEIANLKTGKNGNSIYSLNEMGKQADVVKRIIRGSSDDKFLNGLLSQQNNNFAGFVLLNGIYIKKIGDGLGNITSDTYILSGGIFVKRVEAKTNTEGDATQSVAVYTLRFSSSPRAIT